MRLRCARRIVAVGAAERLRSKAVVGYEKLVFKLRSEMQGKEKRVEGQAQKRQSSGYSVTRALNSTSHAANLPTELYAVQAEVR